MFVPQIALMDADKTWESLTLEFIAQIFDALSRVGLSFAEGSPSCFRKKFVPFVLRTSAAARYSSNEFGSPLALHDIFFPPFLTPLSNETLFPCTREVLWH
jgi:hypothetical protein